MASQEIMSRELFSEFMQSLYGKIAVFASGANERVAFSGFQAKMASASIKSI